MKRTSRWPKLTHGDLIEIWWTDITGDQLGDADEAAPELCRTSGYFHRWKGKGRDRTLVTCLTLYPNAGKGDDKCRGSDTYPIGVIKEIKLAPTNLQTPPSTPPFESSLRPLPDADVPGGRPSG